MDQPSPGPAAPTTAHPPWAVPYVDQPLELWQTLKQELGASIKEVYFPLAKIGNGRPPQPDRHRKEFLRWGGLPGAALLNPIILDRPVEKTAPIAIDELRSLFDQHGIRAATVVNLDLARHIRAALPELELTASVLMDIASPLQAAMLGDTFDVLVPSARIYRDRAALLALRASFPGRIRLMVNEGCIPGCPLRVQHFFEMRSGLVRPRSLCDALLARQPWLRLLGAWVLPQHLHLYDGLYDELKLDGRATLQDSGEYRRVLGAYVHRRPLPPNAIGGGPASMRTAIPVEESFVQSMLDAPSDRERCALAADYFHRMASGPHQPATTNLAG
jgi:hypothetical protein